MNRKKIKESAIHGQISRRTALRVVLCLFAVSLVLPLNAAQLNLKRIRTEIMDPSGTNVLVVAHRGLTGISTGAWDKYPENSLAAFSNAIELGIDIIEVDVRKTKDSHLILMHDPTVDRTTDGTGSITNMTLREIKSLRLKTGIGGTNATLTEQRVPTLEEALRLVKGRCLINLDKAGSLVSECCEVLKRTGTMEQAVFKSSYSPERCQKDYGGLSPPVLFMPIILHKDDWHKKKDQGWAQLEPYSRLLKPCAFELVFTSEEDPIISADTVRKIRESGARLWINTLWESQAAGRADAKAVADPEANWGWVIARGANIIQTDEAERLLQYLRSRKLHW
jgi:glycerophosphoryl diester phosphodiesterase